MRMRSKKYTHSSIRSQNTNTNSLSHLPINFFVWYISTPGHTRPWMPTDSTNIMYIWMFFGCVLFCSVRSLRVSKVRIYLVYRVNAVKRPRTFRFYDFQEKENRLNTSQARTTATVAAHIHTHTLAHDHIQTLRFLCETFGATSTNRTFSTILICWCVNSR